MKVKKEKHQVYGPHLMLDCYRADPKKLADISVIFQFLDQLPKLIGMRKIGPPQVCQFTDCKKAGVTGVVMIVTSHISIHTYSLRRCFFMDIFSCQNFNRKYVEEHVRTTFSVGRMHSRLVQRGYRFPAQARFVESAKRGQS